MREFIKRKAFLFVKDKYCWTSCILAAVLLSLHSYQYLESFRIEPLLRMSYCVIYPPVVFFFGREAILFLFLIFGYTIEQFTEFSNYTAFFIIIFFLLLHPKATIPVIVLYILDVIVVCEHHDKSVIHFAIHIFNCGFIFVASKIIFSICLKKVKRNLKKLQLDETDKEILSRLAEGALQKEIENYSENTVSKRLKKMRERNLCKTNSELIQRFIEER